LETTGKGHYPVIFKSASRSTKKNQERKWGELTRGSALSGFESPLSSPEATDAVSAAKMGKAYKATCARFLESSVHHTERSSTDNATPKRCSSSSSLSSSNAVLYAYVSSERSAIIADTR